MDSGLEERLEVLQKRIAGDVKVIETQQNIVESLMVVNNKLKILTTGRERFNECSRKVNELEELISNPCSIDRESNDIEVKCDVILAHEKGIRKETELLASISNLEKVIDSQSIRDLESLKPKLNQLRLNVLKAYERSRAINEETRHLFTVYANITRAINSQLLVWDKKLSEMEAKKRATALKEFD